MSASVFHLYQKLLAMNTSPSILNLLIVDDEIEACYNLKNILGQYVDSSINILGHACSTTEAEKLIRKYNPDAVLLDIEMPSENAFQFLKRIYPYDFEIIFITAYDEFAIKAFRLNAVDYLLKPVSINDLADSMMKLRYRINQRLFDKYNDTIINVVKQILHKQCHQTITLKALNHIEVVTFVDIYSIEGLGSYCKICFNKAGVLKEIITSCNISYYEDLLPAELFYRVHKSYLINCMHIEDIVADETHYILVKCNQKIPVSRRRYSHFISFLKTNNFFTA